MVEIRVEKQFIHLRNAQISYCIYLTESGFPVHLYFGKRIEQINPVTVFRRYGIPLDGNFSLHGCILDRVPLEYPAFGLGDMREGTIAVRRQDGTATCDLRYVSARIEDGKPSIPGLPATFGSNAKTLLLELRDDLLDLRVTLSYSVFDDCGAIIRSAKLYNAGNETITVERALSFGIDLPDTDYDVITLSGMACRERDLIRRPLTWGQTRVSSLRGASSAQNSPFLVLTRHNTAEDQGEVIAAALVYSGNFTAEVLADSRDNTRFMMGINPTDFAWKLDPGAEFHTPEAVIVYSDSGLGGMSHQFHTICADHLVRGQYAHGRRPILLNSWESTSFWFDEEKLLRIAEGAADAGIELFVLDDGWFGKRNDDNCSLGDWVVNQEKLPSGLSGLADKINDMGMKFGLWFEPEMVSPDSDLYRAHPDWCIHVAGREPVQSRNQLILDLSRQDVCQYIYDSVSSILDSAKIEYVKWDMNRNFSNIGSDTLPADRQRELPHRYMLGLYAILEKLVSRFPNVLFESCASGGGRFDMGMLYYMPQTWCSDNTDALSRCRIQYTTSFVFPPATMTCHVSTVPNYQTGRITPLKTRANVAISGNFGYELDLAWLSEEELQSVQEQIIRAKSLQNTLLYGDFYRLLSPYEGNETAWITVSKDRNEAVFLFVRDHALAETLPMIVRLRGLDEKKKYQVEETGEIYWGSELMSLGIAVSLEKCDAASISWTLRTVSDQ